VTSAADHQRLLESCKTIAVLGISSNSSKAGYYVPAYLDRQGYRILGVNPKLAGSEMFGASVVSCLAELTQPADMVNVFRRPELLPKHLPEFLALSPAPNAIWFQLGIRNEPVAERLRAAGIEVVQDRCTLAEHRRLLAS